MPFGGSEPPLQYPRIAFTLGGVKDLFTGEMLVVAPPTPGMLAQVEELKNSVLRILCRMVKLPSRRLCALWYHAGVERKRQCLWRLTPQGENSLIFVLGVEDK